MREGIHPEWYPKAELTCTSCGTVWYIGSTVPSLRLDVCSNCHPFYTGEQRIMDTEGQVERFKKRMAQRQAIADSLKKTEKVLSTDVDLTDVIKLGKRHVNILIDEGIETVEDVIERLEDEGDNGFLKLTGVGRKVLADIKRGLRNAGYELPEDVAPQEEAEGATE